MTGQSNLPWLRFRRFDPACDGRRYRRQTFRALSTRYQQLVLRTLAVLQELTFEFPTLDKMHREQLRPELVFRHALPFCLTEEAYFEVDERSSTVLAALLAGHTLALTHLDYHLDGSDPDVKAAATGRKASFATSVAYALRMTYVAGRLAEDCGCTSLFGDVFDPVSGFVVARMHEDWHERYSNALLANAHQSLDEYLCSENSRLLGSGYWEVMVRGAFASHGMLPPKGATDVVRELRRLRQIVDEIADFDEDVAAGLITAPLIFALHTADGDDRLMAVVRSLWRTPVSDIADRRAAVVRLRDLVADHGGFELAAQHADRIWATQVETCGNQMGHEGLGFIVLLDLKRAKLQELKAANWRNSRTEAFLV
jgi:hypothetical protein